MRDRGGLVAVGVLCGLLCVLSLALAVGAVVPAVGEALNVERSGVGGLLGYLVATCFFGLPTLVVVGVLRAGRVAAPVASGPGAFASRPAMPLPDGPGLAARWAVAVPLMLLSAFLPWFGNVALTAWWSLSFTVLLPDVGNPDPTYTDELVDGLDATLPVAAVPALVVAFFLLRRTVFAPWPTACVLAGAFVLLPGAFLPIATASGSVPGGVFAVGLLWLTFGLSRLTVHVLSRPVAADVVGSRLELPFRLPGQGFLPPRPRLRIQHDRLVLDRLRVRQRDVGRLVLPWHAIEEVQVESRAVAGEWPPAADRTRPIAVPAGPAVRIRGDGQDWLLPFDDEPTARTVVAAITARARR